MAPFKVLAVDGGGIWGVIPALILAAIEEQTGRPISDLFDLLAGTSTGGIIACGLTKPGADGKADKSANDIVQLYASEGTTIFPKTFLQGLHVGAIRGAKYEAAGIESTLQKHFGDVRLKDALKPVLIPSYDIEKQIPIFFKSERARVDPTYDFPMREVVRATSAAPTYFPPEKIDTGDPLNYYALVDGGIVAGNPALCAYAEAMKMGKAAEDMLVVSLGTGEFRRPIKYADALNWGQLEWAQPIIGIVLQGSNATVDYQLQQLLNYDGPKQSYFRFQVEFGQDTSIDDAGDANLKYLMDLARAYLSQPDTADTLKRLCALLTASDSATGQSDSPPPLTP
ncbi:MAG TPA: patatin-like phospholipase family protein [Chloroflexota bacterium]|nr:patatin-like phospholipase family protein [Chloroflexota bacterium]